MRSPSQWDQDTKSDQSDVTGNNGMKIQTVIQPNSGENGIAAIATMLAYYGCIVPVSELRIHNITSRGGSTPEQMRDMASLYGLDTEIVEADMDTLSGMEMPVVVRWKKRNYCIVTGIRRGVVSIADPAKGEYTITTDNFAGKYMGTVLVMKPGEGFHKGGRRQTLPGLIKGRLKGFRRPLIWLAILNLLAAGLNLLMVKSTRMMPPMARRRMSLAISRAASRLSFKNVLSAPAFAPWYLPLFTSITHSASVRSITRYPPQGSHTLR